MMATVKQDLLKSVLNAPVNLFFDLMPTSKIQGKLQGDIWCIEGLFWFCTWMISEFISISTTIMLIAQQDPTALLYLSIAAVYGYYVQIDENKTRTELIRGFCLFMSEVGQAESELFGGASNIRAMGTQDYALKIHSEAQDYNTLAQIVVMATWQYYSILHRKVSTFIVFAGAAQVIIGKQKGADPVLSLLCFQRMQGLGHTFCGMMH